MMEVGVGIMAGVEILSIGGRKGEVERAGRFNARPMDMQRVSTRHFLRMQSN